MNGVIYARILLFTAVFGHFFLLQNLVRVFERLFKK